MSDSMPQKTAQKSIISRRLMLGLPLLGLGLMGGGFALMLRRMTEGKFDPHALPSQLIGRRVPDFTLPGLAGAPITGAELQHPARPMLVNFFASWCVPCLEEASTLATLAGTGLPIWGIAYKDNPGDTRRFLDQNGNPFARTALDQPGRVAIDWGVYGVPETYLIDAQGIVRWRYAGALTPEVIDGELRPLLAKACA
jgi:cytochrome c biogenesis protein CcmG, thiol:disulfide interchange protein DsbE